MPLPSLEVSCRALTSFLWGPPSIPLLAVFFSVRFCRCSPGSQICNSPASVSRVWGLSAGCLASQFHLRHSIPFSLKNPIDEAMSGTWENWIENRRGDREIPVFSLKLILPAQVYLCLSVCLSFCHVLPTLRNAGVFAGLQVTVRLKAMSDGWCSAMHPGSGTMET